VYSIKLNDLLLSASYFFLLCERQCESRSSKHSWLLFSRSPPHFSQPSWILSFRTSCSSTFAIPNVQYSKVLKWGHGYVAKQHSLARYVDKLPIAFCNVVYAHVLPQFQIETLARVSYHWSLNKDLFIYRSSVYTHIHNIHIRTAQQNATWIWYISTASWVKFYQL